MANSLCLTRFSRLFHAPLTALQAVSADPQCGLCPTRFSRLPTILSALRAVLVCPQWGAILLDVPTRVFRSGCNWADLTRTNLRARQAVLVTQCKTRFSGFYRRKVKAVSRTSRITMVSITPSALWAVVQVRPQFGLCLICLSRRFQAVLSDSLCLICLSRRFQAVLSDSLCLICLSRRFQAVLSVWQAAVLACLRHPQCPQWVVLAAQWIGFSKFSRLLVNSLRADHLWP